MNPTLPAPRTALSLTALLAALVTLLGVLATVAAPAAHAHDIMTGSTPAADAVLAERPGEISLSFNNDLLDSTQVIRVTNASGKTVAEGSPVVSGPAATLTLPEPLGDGAYHVTWSVVSSDGHRIEGEYGFTVAGTTEAAAAPPANTPAPAPTPTSVMGTAEPTASASGDEAPASTGGLPAWAVIAVAVVAAGGVAAVVVRRLRAQR
ncbi:copper resistance CopC family protein [Georgenia sp. SYP-B2076]|uniref:copper resistance CopC family protein n=1 Tax=Georgenia sp. SYP-B2076 TaxID=2495881 RepID=UPI000F8D97B4|nr:copper resistance CopC family protein [Georgenia sp. SYP-B2076]